MNRERSYDVWYALFIAKLIISNRLAVGLMAVRPMAVRLMIEGATAENADVKLIVAMD